VLVSVRLAAQCRSVPVNSNVKPIVDLHRRRTLFWALAAGLGTSAFAGPFLRSFSPPGSKDALLAFLSARGIASDKGSLLQLVAGTVAFYRDANADGLSASVQSDMLLFQWGVYDWGTGENFEFDITRQFISAFSFGDDAISQLRMTAYFAPTPELRKLGAGNRWCSRREDAQDFRAFIVSSPAFRVASGLVRRKVEIGWSRI
jgi:hypothetical protein